MLFFPLFHWAGLQHHHHITAAASVWRIFLPDWWIYEFAPRTTLSVALCRNALVSFGGPWGCIARIHWKCAEFVSISTLTVVVFSILWQKFVLSSEKNGNCISIHIIRSRGRGNKRLWRHWGRRLSAATRKSFPSHSRWVFAMTFGMTLKIWMLYACCPQRDFDWCLELVESFFFQLE